jgi:hypothetical protein
LLWAGLLAMSAVAGGCTLMGVGNGFGQKCPKDLEGQLKVLDMKCVFGQMARELCDGPGEKHGTVLVTDFVELDTLAPNSSGLLMGELMRSSLSSACGYKIQQAELSKYFTLGPNGLAVLTRRGEAIKKDEVSNADFVVGTFSHSPQKLVLFVKKFNLNNSVITKISSKEIDFTCSDWGVEYSTH